MSTLGDTPRPLPKGCALWTAAASHPSLRGVERRSNLVARTIPLAPFLKGRGEVQKCRLWRHILHTTCQWGCTPLDSPLAGAALQLWGANENSGGHPQTPAKGLRPLDTSRAGARGVRPQSGRSKALLVGVQPFLR